MPFTPHATPGGQAAAAARIRKRSQATRRADRPAATAVVALLLTVAVAVLLGACTGKDKDKDKGQAGGQASGPLASVRGDIPGLVVGAASLKREGSNVTLRFTISNQGGSNVTIGDLFGRPGTANSNDTGGVALYDGANRKLYVPSDQTVTTVPLGLDPGKSVELSVTFPDVPLAASSDNLSALVPHFAPLDGLKLEG